MISKPRLDDCEIDQAVRESWAIVAPYRRVTQSGVVPVAFMHGTPVIATNLGAMPESVIPDMTGYLVDPAASFEEWQDQFRRVQKNIERLSANCRQFYLDQFDSRRAPNYLQPVLESVGQNN